MKKLPLLNLWAAAVLGVPVVVNAALISETDPGDGGVPYRWTVFMNGLDSASLARHVGAWSWEDESLFAPGGPTVGWTHNADWVALSLDTAVLLTIRLERKADVLYDVPANLDPNKFAGNNLFPGMTLWKGWDNDGDSSHDFNNVGNVAWAEDLTYIAHQAPPTTGAVETRHVIERTFELAPGEYTFVLGGKSQSTVSEGRQGYNATFTTTAVPEPGTAMLAMVGAALCAFRRPRRMK
ncbi:MAG: PEP-CTERM sorting domain-containing protein [Verrucomicrobiaceae bacterium]|nr:MAG: PEP-CTERM sorting domain-containing protein [Verrucomicrobiaceae bacterium]